VSSSARERERERTVSLFFYRGLVSDGESLFLVGKIEGMRGVFCERRKIVAMPCLFMIIFFFFFFVFLEFGLLCLFCPD
jgi:hypothetical protein